MSKFKCVIGCKSSQANLQNMLRSIVRVYSGLSVSQLQLDWIFPEDDSNLALDVCVIDLDDEDHERYLNNPDYKGYIVISKSAHLLQKYKYALNKPIHNSSLLEILKNLEQDELKELQKQNPTEEAPTSIVQQTAVVKEPIYQLVNWPDLTKVPDELLLNTSRVCALLATQPSALATVENFLQLGRDELKSIIQHINLYAYDNFPTLTQQTEDSLSNTITLPATTEKPTANASFLSKIWSKLKNGF